MQFIEDESGAVTVDWVVLTAALVGLGLATMSVVSSGTQDLSRDIENQLERSGNIISTSFAPWRTLEQILAESVAHTFITSTASDSLLSNHNAILGGDSATLASERDRRAQQGDSWAAVMTEMERQAGESGFTSFDRSLLLAQAQTVPDNHITENMLDNYLDNPAIGGDTNLQMEQVNQQYEFNNRMSYDYQQELIARGEA